MTTNDDSRSRVRMKKNYGHNLHIQLVVHIILITLKLYSWFFVMNIFFLEKVRRLNLRVYFG